MSLPLFTTPIGITFKYNKKALRSSITQTPQSGRHPASATLQTGTIFDLELNWNYLKINGVTTSNDVQYVQEFYEAVGGSNAWFLFDPSAVNLENLTVTQDFTKLKNGFFGIGDGVTRVFPLWRSTSALGGGNVTQLERIQNVTSMAGVYVNGTLTAAYTITQLPSVVTFTTAPANGVTLAWAGSYNYVVQFAEDSLDLDEFMWNLWTLSSLKLTTVSI